MVLVRRDRVAVSVSYGGNVAKQALVALVFAALGVRCAGLGHVLGSRVIASGECRREVS